MEGLLNKLFAYHNIKTKFNLLIKTWYFYLSAGFIISILSFSSVYAGRPLSTSDAGIVDLNKLEFEAGYEVVFEGKEDIESAQRLCCSYLMLEEIPPQEISLFLPGYSPEQIVETYSIIGGVPKYLEMWNDRRPVLKNIEEQILSPVTIFRQEPIFLIHDEISDVRTYLALLEAIGSGMKQQKVIGDKAGIALPHVGKYIHTLLQLGFIRRIISIDAPNPDNTRLTGYEI